MRKTSRTARPGERQRLPCTGRWPRHAPVGVRSTGARVVGWGWPHLQSRAGGCPARRLSGRSRLRPRTGVERQSCVGETEGGASPTLRGGAHRIDQTPGHGADVVEELQGGGCVSARRGVSEAKDPQVNIDLLCGSVGDSEVVEPVSSGTAVAWRPGASAFWSAAARAAGGPASHKRRGRGKGGGRGLRPRRWCAGGLPRGVSSCTGAFRRGGCPASALCGV